MIEVRGIIQFSKDGHRHVDIVVAGAKPVGHERIPFGVDIKPNRGKIITFLAAMYDVIPGDIVWPAHIEL